MISLTNTHERIMHYQGLGKSDAWIAQKLGYSMSDFLTACAFINQWRGQSAPVENIPAASPCQNSRRTP